MAQKTISKVEINCFAGFELYRLMIESQVDLKRILFDLNTTRIEDVLPAENENQKSLKLLLELFNRTF